MTKEVATMAETGKLLPVAPDMAGMFDLQDNLAGVDVRLPQIGIIHQGQLFRLASGEKVTMLQGIVLDKNYCNAWWERSFDEAGGGNPPQCSSLNAITPDYNSEKLQAQRCSECEKNKFGSDGRGKACKNMVRVHILLPNDNAPHRLTLPPSNLRAFNDYVSMITLKGIPYQLVYANLSLVPKKNKDGIEYSEIAFEVAGTVKDPAVAAGIKATFQKWLEAMRGQGIDASEYANE